MGVGSDNLVPRGIAMGASAHSIGTAALMEREPEVLLYAVLYVEKCCTTKCGCRVLSNKPRKRLHTDSTRKSFSPKEELFLLHDDSRQDGRDFVFLFFNYVSLKVRVTGGVTRM